MAESIERLMAESGWGTLVDLLEAELGALDTKLDGELHDQATYAWLHGQRRGILALQDAAQTVLTKRDAWLDSQRKKHEGADAPER